MKFFLLINVKMPTIVGILTFMSRKNSIFGLYESEKKLNFLIFLYLWAFKISCSTELGIKKFYKLGARQRHLILISIISFFFFFFFLFYKKSPSICSTVSYAKLTDFCTTFCLLFRKTFQTYIQRSDCQRRCSVPDHLLDPQRPSQTQH